MGSDQLPASLQESLDNTKVSYAQLGSCGLRVSVPILGAMSFGHKDWLPWVLDSEEDAFKVLKGAYDRGLNTWDTANVYSGGISETIVGNVIKKFNIPRHKLTILTKCFGMVGEQPDVRDSLYGAEMSKAKDYIDQGGLSRAAIFNAADASLKRLQTDYIDLLQIHRFDTSVSVEETMKALHDLVQSGKVRYIGASSMWCYQFAKMQAAAEAKGWTKFVSMQNHYSLCYREEEREMNKYCHETGVGLIPWAPLYRGHLARPLNSDKTERSDWSMNPKFQGGDVAIIKRVSELTDKKGWKMSQVALAWIIQKGTVPIVGFSNLDRLDEACEVRGKRLSDDEMERLEEPYTSKPIYGHK